MKRLLLLTFITLLMSAKSYSDDYFYCNFESQHNRDDDYLTISRSGLRYFENGKLKFQKTFLDLSTIIHRLNSWHEDLSENATLMAQYVPKSYSELFKAVLSQYYSSGPLRDYKYLFCKRVYRHIGRL